MWFFFFFKQKTAYEMRISDWSSDVCSSDLGRRHGAALLVPDPRLLAAHRRARLLADHPDDPVGADQPVLRDPLALAGRGRRRADRRGAAEIGRASCRERGGQYV